MTKKAKQTVPAPVRKMSEREIRQGVLQILAKYRAIEQSREGVRSRPPIEYGNEESILSNFDRLQAVAIGRDLERNNPKAITIIGQREALAVGRVKAQFNTADAEWNAAAGRVFNVDFARDCWFSDAAHLETVAQWVEGALLREGDILLAFDDFLLNSGKLVIWESDQLVTPGKTEWERCEHPWCWTDEAGAKKAFDVDQGVVIDQYGRTVAFCVTNLHFADRRHDRARADIPLSACLVIPAGQARLVRRRFRPGERRGVPALLPVAGNLADIEEMVQSELSTARMRSKIMAWVKRSKDAGMPADAAAEVAAFLERAESGATYSEALDQAARAAANGAAAPAAESEAEAPAPAPDRTEYRHISEAVGGMLDYLEAGEDVTVPSIDRPNLNAAAFFDALGDTAGASLGLARGYTRMAVSSSYTAHRGETCMTDRHIRIAQKQHEHDWLDWLAVKVISRAIARGELAEGPKGWESAISWAMPRPDAIDPEKEARAQTLEMKNGAKTLRDVAGPDWRRKFADFAAQLKVARELGIPLSVFETVAGAVAAVPEVEEEPVTEEE